LGVAQILTALRKHIRNRYKHHRTENVNNFNQNSSESITSTNSSSTIERNNSSYENNSSIGTASNIFRPFRKLGNNFQCQYANCDRIFTTMPEILQHADDHKTGKILTTSPTSTTNIHNNLSPVNSTVEEYITNSPNLKATKREDFDTESDTDTTQDSFSNIREDSTMDDPNGEYKWLGGARFQCLLPNCGRIINRKGNIVKHLKSHKRSSASNHFVSGSPASKFNFTVDKEDESGTDSLPEDTTGNGFIIDKRDMPRGWLMHRKIEKYGWEMFRKDSDGKFACFFEGCALRAKATNFSRHIEIHERKGDKPKVHTKLSKNPLPTNSNQAGDKTFPDASVLLLLSQS